MAITDRPRIRAGQFRHPITLQQVFGSGPTRVWRDLVTVWASIQPQSGWDRAQSLRAPNEIVIEIHIRYQPNVNVRPRMRVQVPSQFGPRTLEITDVLNIRELNRMLVLQCREVTT